MKIVVAKFAGDVPAAGWVVINYASPGGGRTNIGYQFRKGDTWASVASGLVDHMGGNPWPRDIIRAKAEGSQVRMACPDELDPTVFFAEYNPDPLQREAHQINPDFVSIAEEKF